MKGKLSNAESVLVVGNGDLTYSITVCLLRTKYTVNLCTDDVTEARISILTHLSDMKDENGQDIVDDSKLTISESFKEDEYKLVILITAEDLAIKKNAISELEKELSPETIIAINTESICLDVIQEDATHAGRIIGLNWTEPAHTTHFL
ncbi:MAG TPA: 3-hydroxyacyl-CoA dehydrogenase NAD-binding domain-containing protein, partial [Flavitalea sp.]|nr:3-hydroxyacyl-CoA dehydrogenase NAD-binding domain-containing protein [Flavitalea sp.]